MRKSARRCVSDKPDNVLSCINLNTVRQLERLWGTPVDPLRFRAKFYIDGLAPFEEFTWVGQSILMGGVELTVDRRNGRCGATNVNPSSGERDMDIPRALRQTFGHKDVGMSPRAAARCAWVTEFTRCQRHLQSNPPAQRRRSYVGATFAVAASTSSTLRQVRLASLRGRASSAWIPIGVVRTVARTRRPFGPTKRRNWTVSGISGEGQSDCRVRRAANMAPQDGSHEQAPTRAMPAMLACGAKAHRYDAAMLHSVNPRFRLTSNGRFAERLGPQGRGVAHSEKKLCVVATDLSLLCDLLFGLSLRHDCYYVKYGLVEREGMYLGRAFMTRDAAAAELCQELKGNPRLMVSLQDDSYFNDFRTDAASHNVWDDFPEDEMEVAAVIEQAFGRPDEAAIVAAVRATKMAYISLVAGKKPDVEGEGWILVGHVMLSPVTVDGSTDSRGIGVAPVAVIPSEQRKGYGAELVRAGLRRARLLGYRFAVVLGHAAYYPRFGFVPASRFGLSYGADVPNADFMAVELVPGALESVRGVVRYHTAFDE